MSAFVCMPDHFKALAIFATTGRNTTVDPRYIEGLRDHDHKDPNLAALYASILHAQNVRSVNARYSENTPPALINISASDRNHAKYHLTPVAILKMCDCLEYQSCETEDYKATTAHHLLTAIRHKAICALPGYDDAPWDYIANERKVMA